VPHRYVARRGNATKICKFKLLEKSELPRTLSPGSSKSATAGLFHGFLIDMIEGLIIGDSFLDDGAEIVDV